MGYVRCQTHIRIEGLFFLVFGNYWMNEYLFGLEAVFDSLIAIDISLISLILTL